jgi:arginyl-tRNA synthetase
MLNDKGDTAVYLLYAHARICSIIRKSGKDIDELKKTGKIALDHAAERALGLHLLQFAETVEEACTTLLPNVLCKYLYYLSEEFTKFYSNCQVNGSAEETSRLLLCEATAIVMRKCFHLLGITPVYKL